VNVATMLNSDLSACQAPGIYVFLLDVAIHPRECPLLWCRKLHKRAIDRGPTATAIA